MKTFEKVFGILFAVAFLMCIFSIPGYAILTSFSLTILAFFYYIFSFAFFNNIKIKNIFSKEAYRGISALRIIDSIIFGWALSAICCGIQFKMLEWQGGGFMLIVGLIATIIIAIIALIKFFKFKSGFYKPILLRIAIIGCFGLLSLLIY
jgi:hypothetical protein